MDSTARTASSVARPSSDPRPASPAPIRCPSYPPVIGFEFLVTVWFRWSASEAFALAGRVLGGLTSVVTVRIRNPNTSVPWGDIVDLPDTGNEPDPVPGTFSLERFQWLLIRPYREYRVQSRSRRTSGEASGTIEGMTS